MFNVEAPCGEKNELLKCFRPLFMCSKLATVCGAPGPAVTGMKNRYTGFEKIYKSFRQSFIFSTVLVLKSLSFELPVSTGAFILVKGYANDLFSFLADVRPTLAIVART